MSQQLPPQKNRELQKQLAREWKEFTPEFRISATIHDGQWYTKEKWKKVAKLRSIKPLEDWIEDHKNILIEHPNHTSFRVNSKEVVNWYKDNNLDIKKELVPKNYPPRIWNGKTETENFLDTPRETVSSLLIKTDNEKIKEKIISFVQPYAQIKEDEQNKIYAYTSDAEFLKSRLEKILTTKEQEDCELRVRFSFGRRELVDFPDTFLTQALEFYHILVITLLRPHQRTLEIFLPDIKDRNAQISEWIIKAIQKYDETSGVPFSGYLAFVLNRWPYDLPDNILGKPMANYQRRRARVVKELKQFYTEEEISLEMIRDRLPMYTDSQFKTYEEWNNQWLKIRGATNLTWKDKNAEKIGVNLTASHSHIDNNYRSKITRAILNACVKTDNQIKAIELLNQLQNENLDFDISPRLKNEIKIQLGIIMNEEY